MAFNCISLQLSSFVNIYVNICHYSFISGMLRASLDRLLGKNLCIKCIIQVPTKHPNERVLQITWKNQFIAFYRVPPGPQNVKPAGAFSRSHRSNRCSINLSSWRHTFISTWQLCLKVGIWKSAKFICHPPNSSLFWDIHGYSGHLWTAYWGKISV